MTAPNGLLYRFHSSLNRFHQHLTPSDFLFIRTLESLSPKIRKGFGNTPKVSKKPFLCQPKQFEISKEESWRTLDSCERKQVSVNDLRARLNSGFGGRSQPIAFLRDNHQKDKISMTAQTLMVCWALQQFENMSLNCNLRLSFLLLLLALTVPALSAGAWQGTGNMTEDNMTEIRTVINNNPISQVSSVTQIDAVAQAISTRLNGLWDPAWNVAIAKTGANDNTVVYGYAFRDHWMWINGVNIPGTDRYLAYIIWKDYNCHNWKTLNSMISSGSTFTGEQDVMINVPSFSNVVGDVWTNAYNFVVALEGYGIFPAVTVVMSTNRYDIIRGYFCLLNNNYVIKNSIETDMVDFYGSYLLFQTR